MVSKRQTSSQRNYAKKSPEAIQARQQWCNLQVIFTFCMLLIRELEHSLKKTRVKMGQKRKTSLQTKFTSEKSAN